MGKEGISLQQIGSLKAETPSWLVQRLLLNNSLTAIYGPASVGKSFIALSLSVCVATGHPFFGRKIDRPGLVVYIAGEGLGGLCKRYSTWCHEYSIDSAAPSLLVSDRETELCNPASVEKLQCCIDRAIERFGPLRLLVIDTWSRNLAGDDNSQVDAERGIKALSRLCSPWKATGLIIAHEGHEKGRIRGSSALRGDLDHELCVRARGKSIYTLEMTKGRDILNCDDFTYCVVSAEHGMSSAGGNPIISGILQEVTLGGRGDMPGDDEGANETMSPLTHMDRALAILQTMQAERSGGDGVSGPVDADEWKKRCLETIPQSSFYDLKKRLKDQGYLSFIGDMVIRNPALSTS